MTKDNDKEIDHSEIDYSNMITPIQFSNTINKIVSDTIINVIQTTKNLTDIIQKFEINCNKDIIDITQEASIDCKKGLLKKDKNIKKEIINDLCKPIFSCNASNINMDNNININTNAKITNNIKVLLEQKLNNNINQSINDKLGFAQSNTIQGVNNVTNAVSNAFPDIYQNIINKIGISQVINLNNISANYITMTAVSDIISNLLQKNKSYVKSVNDLDNNISQISKNNSSGLTKYATIIFFIIVGIVVFLYILIFFLKRKSTREFIYMITPLFLFIFIVGTITLVLYLTKPKFIYKNGNLNELNFISIICIISIVVGVIIYIYYKYKNKSANNIAKNKSGANNISKNNSDNNIGKK